MEELPGHMLTTKDNTNFGIKTGFVEELPGHMLTTKNNTNFEFPKQKLQSKDTGSVVKCGPLVI